MSKKLTELQAGALNAWTPVQQAALYHQHMTEQYAKDQDAKVKEILSAEKKEKARVKGENVDSVKPDEVSAAKLIDKWIKDWCSPLYDFLDIFGPPHLAIVVFIGLHLLFWYSTPWYFHFLLLCPLQYAIPVYMTLKSIWSMENRDAWQCWWVMISLIEYNETVLFKDGARSMAWWPKLKLLFSVWMYSTAKTQEKKDKSGKKETKPIFGSVVLAQKWLSK